MNAVSLYQSETMVRMDYLQETVTSIGDRQLVIQRATDLPAADYPAGYPMCMDWQTYLPGPHSINVA